MPQTLRHFRICYRPWLGDGSDEGNTLLSDFILLALKLEKLGFAYHKGTVTIIVPDEI